MGFQGDVAGLGLGELLQGLSRGGREGVLTLHGGGLSATLGVLSGQIHLLPEPDEDPDTWRKRSERAWVLDPNERIDTLRMSEIAYAARIERMFEMLDCEGVHFRFEPGPLPQPGARVASATDDDRGDSLKVRTPVMCPPVSVEFMLLEHARLSDEFTPEAAAIQEHDVPRLFDPGDPNYAGDRFWSECDGLSNVSEIADRLSWPLRQARAVVHQHLCYGRLRVAVARELLLLCQSELSENRFARAASRLTGWVRHANAGPPPGEDVQLLLAEWGGGKLPIVIANMEPSAARALLRRIELVDDHLENAIGRWKEMRRHHRHDLVAEVHQTRLQLRSEDEEELPTIPDLLKLARNFQDADRPMRAGVMLRAAADRNPETISARLELGTRMLAVGLPDEGAPWILEACQTLIDQNVGEKALGPLRNLISADPGNRDARSLLAAARSRSARGRKRRRNGVIALAMVGLLSLGAVVQVRIEQNYERKLREISEQIDRPEQALAMLVATFGDDDSEQVQSLRQTLQERLARAEFGRRDAWLEQFRACQHEATEGDPVAALRDALNLSAPPELKLIRENWPETTDLFQSIAARLEQVVAEFGAIELEERSQVLSEERLATTIGELVAILDGLEAPITGIDSFRKRVEDVAADVKKRGDTRAERRNEKERKDLVDLQEQLLAAARAHAAAGDLERSVLTYEQLVEYDKTGKLGRVMAGEIASVRAHADGVADARALANDGLHIEALARLDEVCSSRCQHLLPWRVQTVPSGGRAVFSDGSSRIAPFVVETTRSEVVEFEIQLDGHEAYTVRSEVPGDQLVILARKPDRWWRTQAQVDAPPIAIGNDHIVCDRAGHVARIDSNSKRIWDAEVATLGGIARQPAFLPQRPGHLLILTEDGAAWLIDGEEGRLEGPWSVGAPPVSGPIATGDGIAATFSDGRTAIWQSRLRPTMRGVATVEDGPTEAAPADGPAEDLPYRHGANAGLEILRRRSGSGSELPSPWTPWTVSLDGESGIATVRRRDDEEVFYVRLTGEWSFLAWEAPHSKIPQGRLWVSDGRGLRAFQP